MNLKKKINPQINDWNASYEIEFHLFYVFLLSLDSYLEFQSKLSGIQSTLTEIEKFISELNSRLITVSDEDIIHMAKFYATTCNKYKYELENNDYILKSKFISTNNISPSLDNHYRYTISCLELISGVFQERCRLSKLYNWSKLSLLSQT